jgi:transposase-like protein
VYRPPIEAVVAKVKPAVVEVVVVFPTDEAAIKLLYLVSRRVSNDWGSRETDPLTQDS